MASLSSLATYKTPRTVIGIDCSTKTLAYAKFKDGKFVSCGEIFFEGATLWERLSFIHKRVAGLVESGELQADFIAFEGAILVGNNARTGISLAYVYGAVIGALMQKGIKVETVPPITWQSFIGNKNFTKTEREEVKKDYPGKSTSWYSNKVREMRKQKTLEFSRQFDPISSGSDNIGDAVGIAYYAKENIRFLSTGSR